MNLTKDELKQLFEPLIKGMRDFVDERIAESAKGLQDRVKALEGRSAMVYRGVHSGVNGTDYGVGDVTTWRGQLWYCQRATKARPGESSDWRLMAKAER